MGFDVNIAGVRVVGRIDRMDRVAGDQVSLVDYKTGKPKTQEDADESLQLSVYALALQEKGLKPVSLRLYNLQDQSSFGSTRHEEQLNADRQIIASVAMGIANEQFDATPDRHCAWCAYYSICPKTEEASVPVALSFKAKAVQ
jgi:RecB family exonuclease